MSDCKHCMVLSRFFNRVDWTWWIFQNDCRLCQGTPATVTQASMCHLAQKYTHQYKISSGLPHRISTIRSLSIVYILALVPPVSQCVCCLLTICFYLFLFFFFRIGYLSADLFNAALGLQVSGDIIDEY